MRCVSCGSASTIGVWNSPGAIVTTRMPKRASSRAAGKRHANDARLRSGVGGLANLPLIGGDRGGVDDDAALAFFHRVEHRHIGRGETQQVERADQVDADHALEGSKRHGPVASDDAARGADAGAVDQDAGGTVHVARLRHGGFGRRRIGTHIAGDAVAALG